MVFMAGIIFVLTGFAILAIDVGRIYIVRTEMQNVADSSALAGANCLTRQTLPGSTSDCISTTTSTLNWGIAQAKATYQLGQNTADNIAISTTDSGHQVGTGYWNLLTGSPSGGALVNTFSPITVNDKPAVRVTVTKDTNKNNGPITMLTGKIFGGSDVPMTASAVAVISSPGNVPPSSLIPQAINKCMYDKFWNAANGTPIIYTGSPLDPYGLSVIGQPWKFRIGSAYHYDTCESGQWTSFNQDVNSQSAISALITNGNPTTLNIGDLTWIEPGTKTASYNDLNARYPKLPVDVSIIVVDTADLTNKGTVPIVAFAGFSIDAIQGGSGKYIQGNFIANYLTPGSGGIGPFYGTYTPPRLAQ